MSTGEAMNDKKIKQIPYGISDYSRIVRKNGYYVDKTMYLETIENTGDYLFFIRPRRFGKSLLLSVMEAYYDILYKDKFEEYFKDTFIYNQPTEERGAFLVLKFNFSAVEPAADKMETSFLNHVRGKALSFLRKYSDYLVKDNEFFKKNIEQSQSGSDILSTLINLCKDSNQKLYVIIDEYDNFTNTVLSTSGQDVYKKLTHGDSFYRSFFNVLKAGTGDMEAAIKRLFLTGVSPVTLDDVTSGFNIGENISLDPAFNQMLGFSKKDVNQMIDYYRTAGLLKHDSQYVMNLMTDWYGNYLFSKHSNTEDRMYNADMVLYFLKEYFKTESIPDDLIDRNVRIDYRKLKHLIIVNKGQGKSFNGNFNRLKEIIEDGGTSADLVKAFPLEQLTDTKNFVSLLFYFGLLTIDDVKKDKIRFKIPNETVQRLYYDYMEEGYRETDTFALDIARYSNLMSDMAYDGKWKPLFDYITNRMRESMSLRDLITGEKSIQAFLNVYLGLSQLYIIHPEKELNLGYADILMEPFLARYEGIRYSYLLEIKYIKASQAQDNNRILQMKTEAEKQLKKYSLDEKLKKNIEKTTLIKLVLIFSGNEPVYVGEVEKEG
jgi:hypothetical protein